MDKKYLSIDLDKMYMYSKDDCYSPDKKSSERRLSNGQKPKLIFEYTTKKNEKLPTHLKEFVTRRTYVVNYGFKSVPGSIDDKKYGTVAYEGDAYPMYFNKYLTKEEILEYFSELKSNGLYKEYTKLIMEFYLEAKNNKEKNLQDNEELHM